MDLSKLWVINLALVKQQEVQEFLKYNTITIRIRYSVVIQLLTAKVFHKFKIILLWPKCRNYLLWPSLQNSNLWFISSQWWHQSVYHKISYKFQLWHKLEQLGMFRVTLFKTATSATTPDFNIWPSASPNANLASVHGVSALANS